MGIVKEEEMEELCDLAVRGLEELIDYQEYVEVARLSTVNRRSLTSVIIPCTFLSKE